MPRAPTFSPGPGDRVLHRHNRELGPGVIESATPARLRVHFPRSGETLEFARASHPFVPFEPAPGTDPERWFDHESTEAFDRLARLDVDDLDAFRNRLDAFELMERREAAGLGSFLGGRIELFPHQLHVAERAAAADPVRWLLADEVGLGKTVEACLVINHLLRTRRAERVLVIAPRSLVVQWLGELWRKFHQVFVLIDDERRLDALKEKGAGVNPFDAFSQVVVALEDLVENPDVAKQAREADLDLLVVDEAHRLRRARGTPGEPAYRAVAPLALRSEHLLLLTATPLEADAHAFYRLLELLHPETYSSEEAFDEALARGEPLSACTSATRRADIGGLPPRVAQAIDLPPDPDRFAEETRLREEPAANAEQVAARVARLERFLLDPSGNEDPRLLALAKEAKRWVKAGEKSLVFVHRLESLHLVKKELEFHTSRRVAVFHEDLSPEARDLEVARFASEDGPPILVATESGGEGRNFQFAKRLVLFDLPWEPALTEQRIGRLDRIDRRGPVEIVYFRPAEGLGADIARLVERIGVFKEPLGALDRELGGIAAAIRETAGVPGTALEIERLAEGARQSLQKVRKAAYAHLHRDRYVASLAPSIRARIPQDLEERTLNVVLEACRQYGFKIAPKDGEARYYFEFGAEATVETLHGVPQDSRWLGTFDREEAVAQETLDFFAAGHPLVEAVMHEVVDGNRGMVTLVEWEEEEEGEEEEREERKGGAASGGVVYFTREGAVLEAHAVDFGGRPRPEWADRVRAGGEDVKAVPIGLWEKTGWKRLVEGAGKRVGEGENVVAVCGVRVR